MKFIARTFILLLVMNSLLLYMHYNEAGSAISTTPVKVAYAQEIEVINRPDGLYIHHHFKGLTDARHEIDWPETSTNRSCYLDDSMACSRLDEDALTFVEGEASEQSIMYMIPIDQPLEKMMLFKDIFATLDHSVAGATMFHLTDEMDIGGLWVNGLERIGRKKTDLIDYSLFQGFGEVDNLYWQQKDQPLVYSGDRLSVLGTNIELNGLEEIDEVLRMFDAPHATIVQGDPSVTSTRFIVSNAVGEGEAADSLLVNAIYGRYIIQDDERLAAETVASLLSRKAVGSEKSHAMYEALTETLTEAELEQVVEMLYNIKEEVMSATVLDELIGTVLGFNTSFFTRNNTVEAEFYPLLLEDPRKLHIAGKGNLDTSVILKDGKTLYPATKIMNELGYVISSNEQSIYIENDIRKFRFPLRDLFYVYNEQKYNLMSIPFERIGEEFYFEETAFIRIFLVGIEKTAETIEIVPITMFAKEGES